MHLLLYEAGKRKGRVVNYALAFSPLSAITILDTLKRGAEIDRWLS